MNTEIIERANYWINNEKIILTESKAWCDNYTELEEIANDLNNAGINCELEVKTRKTTANTV